MPEQEDISRLVAHLEVRSAMKQLHKEQKQMTKQALREKIAEEIAKYGHFVKVTDDERCAADKIFTLICEEIEKVENPYPHFYGESLVHGSCSETFEQCRLAILALLK